MHERLEDAIRANDIAFLEQKMSLTYVHSINEQRESLLMVATYEKNYEAAKLLINRGADPNIQDKLLNSPFLYAGASGQLDFVKLFLANGARFDVYNRFRGTALIPACERGHIAVVRLLANTYNFPLNHINKLGWTALMEAVILGDGGARYIEIVKILLKAGADKEIADHDGVLPLEHALANNFTEIVDMLR